MKRTGLLFLLALLSTLSGYLMSKASFVGKAGMSLFYRQYNFLKIWWQGGLLVFVVLLLLFGIQGWLQKRYPQRSRGIQVAALIIAAVGLYFTYADFRDSLSHRFLGERFHLGAYLFWIGWMMVSLFYLIQRQLKPEEIK